MRVLLWVVALVPLAVFGVVATTVARQGFELFLNLGWFILVVLAGLTCQLCWYLGQLAIFARMSPWRFLRGAADVMAGTFSTSSTAATMPITLRSLIRPTGSLEAVGPTGAPASGRILTMTARPSTRRWRPSSSPRALGANLSPRDQVVIVLTTLMASVGWRHPLGELQ